MTILRGLDQNHQILAHIKNPRLSHEIQIFSSDPLGTQFHKKMRDSPAGFVTYILRQDWAVVSNFRVSDLRFSEDTEFR